MKIDIQCAYVIPFCKLAVTGDNRLVLLGETPEQDVDIGYCDATDPKTYLPERFNEKQRMYGIML